MSSMVYPLSAIASRRSSVTSISAILSLSTLKLQALLSDTPSFGPPRDTPTLLKGVLIQNLMDSMTSQRFAENVAREAALVVPTPIRSATVRTGWKEMETLGEEDEDVSEDQESNERHGEDWFEQEWRDLHVEEDVDRYSASMDRADVVVVDVCDEEFDDFGIEDGIRDDQPYSRLEFGSFSSTEGDDFDERSVSSSSRFVEQKPTTSLALREAIYASIPPTPALRPVIIKDKMYTAPTPSFIPNSTHSLHTRSSDPPSTGFAQDRSDTEADSDDDSEGPITPPQPVYDDFTSSSPPSRAKPFPRSTSLHAGGDGSCSEADDEFGGPSDWTVEETGQRLF